MASRIAIPYSPPIMHITDFDPAAFLRDYWQKKPLLIRNAFDGWTNPLDPDELAGLACEEGIESRIVKRKKGDWSLSHGPFSAKRFGRLGKTPWTLLVQAVDHHVPDVAALIDAFRFVPNWRIDDVMVSYASDGGGVGPHFDQYDVFLVQGLGKRRWQVGQFCDQSTRLMPHDDLRLLADFEAAGEWVLEPGDILYVPPRLAHDGIAVGDDCMTYSIGFRAPSRAELITDWCQHLTDALTDEDRYGDPDLGLQDNPGEIAPAALDRLHAMVTEHMLDRTAFARWFGQFSSTPKYAEEDWRPTEPVHPDDLRAAFAAGVPLCRNPASRFSFIRHGKTALSLFVDGECFDCKGAQMAFAEEICASDHLIISARRRESTPVLTLIAALVDQGSLALESED